MGGGLPLESGSRQRLNIPHGDPGLIRGMRSNIDLEPFTAPYYIMRVHVSYGSPPKAVPSSNAAVKCKGRQAGTRRRAYSCSSRKASSPQRRDDFFLNRERALVPLAKADQKNTAFFNSENSIKPTTRIPRDTRTFFWRAASPECADCLVLWSRCNCAGERRQRSADRCKFVRPTTSQHKHLRSAAKRV